MLIDSYKEKTKEFLMIFEREVFIFITHSVKILLIALKFKTKSNKKKKINT